MNWDQIEGNWQQFKGNVKEKWGMLTDDQLDLISGKRDQLVGKIQTLYGISIEEAENQLEEWRKNIDRRIQPYSNKLDSIRSELNE
jgi:uncharacterized protein YjbJ (UPF0337 family)